MSEVNVGDEVIAVDPDCPYSIKGTKGKVVEVSEDFLFGEIVKFLAVEFDEIKKESPVCIKKGYSKNTVYVLYKDVVLANGEG